MTASQWFKIYDVLKKYIEDDAVAKALLLEIEVALNDEQANKKIKSPKIN